MGPPDYFHRDAMLAGVPEEAYDQVKAAIRHGDLETEYDVEKIVANVAAQKKLEAEQSTKLKPRSKPKRIRKAWKRSATTLRCKPEKTATVVPIAASTQRAPAAMSAALRAPQGSELPPSSASNATHAHDPG